MAEYKPKHDDQMAADPKADMPHPTKPVKREGDKLQHAADEAARKPRDKHSPIRPPTNHQDRGKQRS